MENRSAPWLPYGKQQIEQADIDAVVEVLQSAYLTTGPTVDAFERAFEQYTGAEHAVAVNSGTAALHAMLACLGVGEGDEVIVPSITFAATANAVVYVGATPVFADVDPRTILIGPEQVEPLLTSKTKAVIAVDYAGQPCDYKALGDLLRPKGIRLLADACHSLGGGIDGHRVGTLADASTFSFHPVKGMTTGEGGMVTTDDRQLADKMRRFRNHGISVTNREREQNGGWYYEIAELGMNYRLSDLQCALGTSQLRRLDDWIAKRQKAASRYDECFTDIPGVSPLRKLRQVNHAYHLYVVRIAESRAGGNRDRLFAAFRECNVGVNVHYIPVHLHPYYRKTLKTTEGQCPNAESFYREGISLPVFPEITKDEQARVCEVFETVTK